MPLLWQSRFKAMVCAHTVAVVERDWGCGDMGMVGRVWGDRNMKRKEKNNCEYAVAAMVKIQDPF